MDVLTCPKCREETLERRERMVYERDGAGAAVPPLVPARCTRCHGLWLTRDDIARLRAGDASLALDDAPETPPVDPEADRRGGLCPDCGRILVRAFLDETAPAEEGAEEAGFYLDRCAHCGGIWFDAGEWQELVDDPTIDDLSRLWDPKWRHERSESLQRAHALQRLESHLGPELLAAIGTVVEMLREEPEKRAEALAHLHEQLGFEPHEPR